MMISNLFSKGTNVIIVWLAFLAWGIVLFQLSHYPKIKGIVAGADLPEEMFGYSENDFYGFVSKLGEGGIVSYQAFQFFDFLNAALLGLATFCAIFYFLEKLGLSGVFRIFLVLPIMGGLTDVLENSMILTIISSFPAQSENLVEIASLLTQAKLIVVSLAFLFVLVFGVCVLGRSIIGRLKT